MRVSIRAVAEKCQVSRQTVSSALFNTGRVSSETRAKVLQVAQEMGYRPNSIARTMKSGRFGTIALLLSSKEGRGWIPEGMLEHVHDELTQHDLHLTVARLPDEMLLSEQGVPRLLREWACDGLLINYIYDIPGQLLELIEQYSIPAIWLNTRQDHDCVYPDDFKAAYQLTSYLVGLGHRKIAISHYADVRTPRHYSTHERMRGYLRAMKEAGYKPQYVGESSGFNYSNMVEYSQQWLTGGDLPTAVIALAVEEAIAIMCAAGKVSLRIPEDISLSTFSFGVITERVAQLTYMQLPHELGNIAVQMLMDKIENPARVLPARAVAATLNKGATCGPPRGSQ